MHRYQKGFIVFLILTGSLLSYCWVITATWIEEGQTPKAEGDNQYAVVLGAKVNGTTPSLALQFRLEAAYEYAITYPHIQLILSGGQGPGEDCSEAKAMYNYLVDRGIDTERLLVEDQSTSTYENLLYSAKLLPMGVSNITIISSDFHLKRAQMLANALDLQADVVAAKTPSVVEGKLRFRERLALLKTKIVGK